MGQLFTGFMQQKRMNNVIAQLKQPGVQARAMIPNSIARVLADSNAGLVAETNVARKPIKEGMARFIRAPHFRVARTSWTCRPAVRKDACAWHQAFARLQH